MRWAKTTLRNSFFGWLANQSAPEPSARLEGIRKAMLDLLEQSPDGSNSAIERRILFARNLDDLWYLRPDLMTAIAATRGEFAASSCMADITRMFDTDAVGKLRRSPARTPPIKR